jgi:hypothetical protein
MQGFESGAGLLFFLVGYFTPLALVVALGLGVFVLCGRIRRYYRGE